MSQPHAETMERLRRLIAESCAVPPDLVVGSARLRGYGIDSVRIMDLMFRLEEDFSVQFNIEELDGIRTVADLAAYIELLRQRKGEDEPCKTAE
jgi:acyl carrier protein